MKRLISIFLWAIGLVFFIFTAAIVFICMVTLPKKHTFAVIRFLFKILIRLMGIKLEVSGLENIRPDTSCLIMGNHQSMFDVFVIPAAIPIIFVGVEASYHFSLPIWGYLTRKWGNIPIERRNLKNAVGSLKIAKESLACGMNIVILPEGHRTLTGKLLPFKKGPFYLAKDANADILPFGINGLFNYHNKNSWMITPGTVKVNIGTPIAYESIKDLSVEELSALIFDRIYNLSCQ